MLLSVCRDATRWFLHRDSLAQGSLLLVGLLCGFSVLTTVYLVFAELGTTLIVTTCVVAAAILAMSSPWQFAERLRSARLLRPADWFGGCSLSCLTLAAATVAGPWSMQFSWSLMRSTSNGSGPSVTLEWVIASVASFLTVGVTLAAIRWCLGCWGRAYSSHVGTARRSNERPFQAGNQSVGSSQPDLRRSALFLMASATGILLGVHVFAPWWNLSNLRLGTAALSACLGIVGLLVPRRMVMSAPSQEDVVGAARCTVRAKRVVPAAYALLFSLGAGAIVASASRLLHQLIPVGFWVVATEWGVSLAGFAVGTLWLSMRRRDVRGTSGSRSSTARPWNFIAWYAVAAWAIGLVILFAALTDSMLWINATIASVGLAISARVAVIAVVLAPLFAFWFVAIARSVLVEDGANNARSAPTARARRWERTVLAWSLVTAATGFLLCRWLVLPNVGVARALICGALWVALSGVWQHGSVFLAGSGRRVAQVACLAVIAGVLFAAWGYRTAALYTPRRKSAVWPTSSCRLGPKTQVCTGRSLQRSARLLFDANVFLAKCHGVPGSLLTELDERRCIAVREGTRSTYTVWKRRGALWEIRESGVPKSVVSTNTRICPDYAPEVLHAVVPLALHEKPRRVLLLGIGGGSQLSACLAYPVQRVTCVEADRTAVGMARTRFESVAAWANPFTDDRLNLVVAEPAWSVDHGSRSYDVIIDNPDAPVLMQSVPRWTAEYYARVAHALTADGIYCQRFQNIDCGAKPFQVLVRTMRSAFRQVAAAETAPGEILFLGTNGECGFQRAGLFSRLQAPHLRSLLADLGLDWSELSKLSFFSTEALQEIASADNGCCNTAANGLLGIRLPLDVMRWGAKRQELVALLAPHTRWLASLLGDDAQDPDLQQRLREVAQRHELVLQHPDQYWAYRKTLKTQLTKHPRSTIRLVSGEMPERQLHADDQRRFDYIAALDRASRHPTPDRIREVAAYDRPYDPMLSPYVPSEVAALWSRSPKRDVREELTHRLHGIYFAPSDDRSIRDVIAAIELLCSDVGELPEATERWDHLNALTQTLMQRWLNRRSVQPTSSPIVLNDVDQSLLAIERSLETMDSLAEQTGIQADAWNARRRWIQKYVVRPLQSYRAQILPHHFKDRTKADS